MLTTLILTLFALLQDPGFTWSEQTDHDFWHAVHLLEVEEEAAQAADLLLEIAEREEVAATPGQAAFIRARAHLALLRTGRRTEATQLLEEILRQSAGTVFETPVADLLRAAEAEAGAQEPVGLDPGFLTLVKRLLAEERSDPSLFAYGTRVLPYYLAILEKTRTTASYDAAAKRVFTFAAPIANDSFYDGLRRLLDESGSFPEACAFFLEEQLLSGDIPEGEAGRAYDRFLAGLAGSDDLATRRLVLRGLVRSEGSLGSETARTCLTRVLSDRDDLLAPLVADSLEYESTGLIPMALRSPQFEVVQAARLGILSGNRIDVQYPLARSGVEYERWILAALLVPSKRGSYRPVEIQTSDGRSWPNNWRGVSSQLDPEVEQVLNSDSWRSWSRSWEDPSPGVYREQLQFVLSDPEPRIRRIGVKAAAGHAEWGVLAEVLRDGAADDIALVLALAEDAGGPGFLDFLEAVKSRLGPGIQGELAARLIIGWHEKAEVVLTASEWRKLIPGAVQLGLCDSKEFRNSLRKTLDQMPAQTAALAELVTNIAFPHRFRVPLAKGLLDARPSCGDSFYRLLLEDELAAMDRDSLIHDLLGDWVRTVPSRALAQGDYSREQVEGLVFVGKAAMGHDSMRNSSRWLYSIKEGWERGLPATLEILQRVCRSSPTAAGRVVDFMPTPKNQSWHQDYAELILETIPVSDQVRRSKAGSLLRTLSSSGEWITHPEVAGVILRKADDPALTRVALKFLAQADPLPEETLHLLERYLVEPAFAATAASGLAGRPQAAGLVAEMIEAWSLPELQDRSTLLDALGKTQDDRVVPVLLAALGDRNEEIAAAAGRALDRIKRLREERETWEAWSKFGVGKSPAAALLGKLSSDKHEVRLAAIASLGTLKATEALPFLIELLEDEDQSIAAAARKALAKINAD